MIKNLKDSCVLSEIKLAVQTEKKATARVLAYLCEVDIRQLWLKEGYSSLRDFCMRYLNYSEGEADRRIQACRLTSKVEEIRPLLEQNKLSLTSISLLSPVLTEENAKEILPKVIRQPTREVIRVIAQHFPERAIPEKLIIELDDELKKLLEEAKKLASEKNPKELFKITLRSYIKEKTLKRPVKVRIAQAKQVLAPQHHTRHIPAPLARKVKERDGYQCTYNKNGVRCNQTAHLQIDHIRPWAMGGSSQDKNNLRLLCRAHNLYLAKVNFPNIKFQRKVKVKLLKCRSL